MCKSFKRIVLAVLFLLCALPVVPAEPVTGKILGGSPDAPIRIEVFSDFECPSCRILYLDVMRRVMADYSNQNKVCLIYHEYPLPQHRHAKLAARYVEAASQLGRQKLIAVFDALFMDQAKWAENGQIEATLLKAVSRAELQKLKKIMLDPAINETIEKEIGLGKQYGISSTPTFFVFVGKKQPQKVEGLLTYPSVKIFLDQNLR